MSDIGNVCQVYFLYEVTIFPSLVIPRAVFLFVFCFLGLFYKYFLISSRVNCSIGNWYAPNHT